jgi:cell wall assembly regulator SMI1
MSADRPAAASEAWLRVIAWCAERAPVTAAALRGPADEAALTAVQQGLGHVWPEDLVAWLRVSDGADRISAAGIIPGGFIPSPIERVPNDWRMMTYISRDVGEAADLEAMEGEPAGSRASLFLSAWVPIADDGGGDWLFVDLRPGEFHGCVGRFREDGFHGPDYGIHFWASVADMAQTLAEALEIGRWAANHNGEQDLAPIVIDGVLHWVDADEAPSVDPISGDIWQGSEELATKVFMLYARDYTDEEIAERLGIPLEQVAQLRDDFRQSH